VPGLARLTRHKLAAEREVPRRHSSRMSVQQPSCQASRKVLSMPACRPPTYRQRQMEHEKRQGIQQVRASNRTATTQVSQACVWP